MTAIAITQQLRQFDVYRHVFPFGAGEWLDRIQAKDRPTAEQLAKTRFGSAILVVLAFGSKRRAQRTTAQELARKSSPHRRSR